MPISFIGGAVNKSATGADVTLVFPGGLQEGDLVVVAHVINIGADRDMVMLTAGYTEVVDVVPGGSPLNLANLGVYWKVMGAAPEADCVVRGDPANPVAAACMILRGVDGTTPMDVAPTTATAVALRDPDPPPIDHNNPAGAWTVAVGCVGYTNDGTAVVVTPPAGYDAANDQAIVVGTAAGSADAWVAMAYRVDPADPEDPGTFRSGINADSDTSWSAATIALKPSPSPDLRAFPFITDRPVTTLAASDARLGSAEAADAAAAEISPSDAEASSIALADSAPTTITLGDS